MSTVRRFFMSSIMLAAVAASGCGKKTEPAPAAPSASAATVATFEPPPAASSAAPVAEAAPVAAAPKPDSTQIKACCAALHAEEGKAAAKDKTSLKTAATVCDGIEKLVASGKTKHADAITSIHATMKARPCRRRANDRAGALVVRRLPPNSFTARIPMRKVPFFAKLAPAALLLLVVGSGCKKKEEEPAPIPSAIPAPTPVAAPTPVVVMPEEDAAVDAPVDAPVKKAGNAAPADVAGLRACCNALQQNAASMPPPQNA